MSEALWYRSKQTKLQYFEKKGFIGQKGKKFHLGKALPFYSFWKPKLETLEELNPLSLRLVQFLPSPGKQFKDLLTLSTEINYEES